MTMTGTARESVSAPIRKGRMRDRGIRKPTHPYSVEQECFQIQPHFIAPVLPGETLVSLSDQSRTVTDPVLNKLTGWWLEKSYFYVPHSKMPGRDVLVDMHVDFDKDMSSLDGDGSTQFYGSSDTIDFVAQCLQSVVGAWYRDEDETWDTPSIGDVPLARLSRRNFMNSFMLEAAYEALDVTVIHQVGTPDITEAREVVEALDQWEFQRKVEGEDWNYEDYLRDQGVSVPEAVRASTIGDLAATPERLMTQIEWSFPTNTVDQTDGSVTSAVIWSPKIRIKDKFFKEPGFIFGVTVVRPKTYLIGQTSSMSGWLNSASDWLPALLEDNPESTIKKIGGGTEPYNGVTGASVLDVKDLFLHGEQFVNHTIAAADNGINIPEADGDRSYAIEADLDALFVTPAGGQLIRTDGRVSLRVRSHVKETSAATG